MDQETGKDQGLRPSTARKGDLDSAVRQVDFGPLKWLHLSLCTVRESHQGESGAGERADGGGQGTGGWSPRELVTENQSERLQRKPGRVDIWRRSTRA